MFGIHPFEIMLAAAHMKLAWCWRCKNKVPMFDEEEFRSIRDAYSIGAHEVKTSRLLEARGLQESDESTILAEIAPRYHELAGSLGDVPTDILKHRLSLLGPPCENCGKELRTPQARKCVECGYERDSGVAQSPVVDT